MNIAKLKKINETIPGWMKRPFSALIRRQLIANKVFLQEYETLEEQQSLPMQSNDQQLLNRIKTCLVHAYEHTEYYHQLFDKIGLIPQRFESLDELKGIPELTKEQVALFFDELVSDDCDDFYEITTGGTSGKPTKILMERNAIYREWAFVYHYWAKFGYDFRKSRIATLRGVSFGDRFYEYNPLYSEIRLNPFVMSERNIERYVKKLRKYGASFLYGYPSAVCNFCRLCKNCRIDIRNQFLAIFLISENVYADQENIIRSVTDAPIAMFYGHSERAVFAERTAGGGYVFNLNYGYVEIEDNGTMRVTGFMNRKMPLIRYIVDDIAIQQDDRTFKIIGHHDRDVLYGRNGVQVSMAAMNFHDDSFAGVEAYQFVQDEIGTCRLNIMGNSHVNLNAISSSVRKKLGDEIRCQVVKVDSIEYTKRGKYQMLIQNCLVGEENDE